MRINKFFDSIVEQLVLDSLTKMHEKLRLAVLPLMVIDALFEHTMYIEILIAKTQAISNSCKNHSYLMYAGH